MTRCQALPAALFFEGRGKAEEKEKIQGSKKVQNLNYSDKLYFLSFRRA